jgi:hypothetical protein
MPNTIQGGDCKLWYKKNHKYVVVELSQELLLNLHDDHGEEDNMVVELGSNANIELARMVEGGEEVLWAKIKQIDAELG